MMVGRSQEEFKINDKHEMMMQMNDISAGDITKGVMPNLERENVASAQEAEKGLSRRGLLSPGSRAS